MKSTHSIIGWREWVGFPELGIAEIKAKIDTGDDISILHPFYVDPFEKQGQPWIHFGIHPNPDDSGILLNCEARITDHYLSEDDLGNSREYPIISTPVVLGNQTWTVNMVIIQGEEMRFRVQLGQSALRGRFVVDAEASFLMGLPAADGAPG